MAKDYFGKFYWCVKTKLSEDGEIYLNADRVTTANDGSLAFWHDTKDGPPGIMLLIAGGSWTCVYAANADDGSSIAVEYWAGEFTPPSNGGGNEGK